MAKENEKPEEEHQHKKKGPGVSETGESEVTGPEKDGGEGAEEAPVTDEGTGQASADQPENNGTEESSSDGAKTEAEDAGDSGSGKKSFFGRKDKKDKTDPLKEQIKDLTDKCMRQMAEFENFRKRTDKEKAQMFDTGAAHVIEKLLPVVDSFERGLASVPETDKGSPLAEGMDKIYKQLYKSLEELGVTPIEALGKEFDPNFHNAVMQTEATEEYPSGVVSQEMQKGYLYHETVIRHSMVAVAE